MDHDENEYSKYAKNYLDNYVRANIGYGALELVNGTLYSIKNLWAWSESSATSHGHAMSRDRQAFGEKFSDLINDHLRFPCCFNDPMFWPVYWALVVAQHKLLIEYPAGRGLNTEPTLNVGFPAIIRECLRDFSRYSVRLAEIYGDMTITLYAEQTNSAERGNGGDIGIVIHSPFTEDRFLALLIQGKIADKQDRRASVLRVNQQGQQLDTLAGTGMGAYVFYSPHGKKRRALPPVVRTASEILQEVDANRATGMDENHANIVDSINSGLDFASFMTMLLMGKLAVGREFDSAADAIQELIGREVNHDIPDDVLYIGEQSVLSLESFRRLVADENLRLQARPTGQGGPI